MKDNQQTESQGGLLHAVQPLLELLVVFLFVTTFLFQITRIPTPSMVPALRVGDVLLLDKQSYTGLGTRGMLPHLLPPADLHRGDLAVFYFPVDPSLYVVKRVIAVPGDSLHLQDGVVFLNGLPLPEPYAVHDARSLDVFRDDFPSFRAIDPDLDPEWWAKLHRMVRSGELTVPPGNVFVLGDNRDYSNDSRYWGFVPERNLVGRPLFVFVSSQPAVPAASGPWARMKRSLTSVRIVR